MNSICGAECDKCVFKENCQGCEKTCGKPFGEECIAAKYIKTGGKNSYVEFKQKLLDEVNELLCQNGLPAAETLCELNGSFVNLEYTLPNGNKAKFLSDKKIYLGTQIEVDGLDMCYGVVADTNFILISSYYENGENPELVVYKQR